MGREVPTAEPTGAPRVPGARRELPAGVAGTPDADGASEGEGTLIARLEETPSPLAWLGDLLWPAASGSRVALTRGGGASSRDERAWAVMPSASNPTVLIPIGGRAGASALRQFNDSMSQPARIRKAAVGAAVRAGAGRLIARDRFVVTPVATDAATQDLIGSVLPGILGVPRIEVAISIGRQLRPNLKPVLQIMRPDGKVLAYAKIGWNDLTRDRSERGSRPAALGDVAPTMLRGAAADP